MADPISAGAAVAGAVAGGIGTLTDVIESIKEASARSIIIEVSNCTPETLSNPLVFMSTGQVLDPPPPTIPADGKAAFSFCKHDTLLEAVYGVMTYDVFDSKGKQKAYCRLAIMFSVPQDRVTFKNVLGIGVFERGTKCDYQLLKLMYDKNNTKSSSSIAYGNMLSYSYEGYVIKATMSQTAHATMKVEIYKGKK